MKIERPLITAHDKTALVHRDREITYRQLLGNIEMYGKMFSAGPGDVCCFFAENRPEWIYAFYAVWKKGGINSAVDYNASSQEVRAVLEDCRPKLIFTSSAGAGKLAGITDKLEWKPKVFIFEEMNERMGEARESLEDVFLLDGELEDIALILYTSGTTGRPKGVMLDFRSVLFNVDGVMATGMLSFEDVLLALFPFHHTVPLQGHIICPLFAGSTIVFIEQLSSEEILRLFRTYKISLINGVPRLYSLFHRGIMKKIHSNLLARLLFAFSKVMKNTALSRKLFSRVHRMFGDNVKVFLSGGARLEKEIAEDFWALGIPMIEGYGLTEMGPLISYNLLDDWRAGSVGKPVHGVDVRIEDGEILARSPGMMRGYFNNPEDTKRIIRNGWVHTGDSGYRDEEGFLYLTGRKKEQIVLANGKNINPEDIESEILQGSSLIREIAVTEFRGKLFAYIYPDTDQIRQKGIKNIREAVKWDILDGYNRRTTPYKRILRFTICLEELPKTPLGKIKRYLLENPYPADRKEEADLTDREPDFPEYLAIQKYLLRETGLKIFPSMHLELDAGLDSMSLLELALFIEKNFAFTLKQEDLIQYPRLIDLAEYVRQNRPPADFGSGVLNNDFTRGGDIELPEPGFFVNAVSVLLNPLITLLFGLVQGKTFPVKGRGPFIIVPNHQSFLDPFLLARTMPRRFLKNTFFLAKANVFRSFLGAFFARNTNSILLDLHKPTSAVVRTISSVLSRGKNVVIFPEGTRTFDGKVGGFKKTFAVLSKELGVPVLPVAIEGAYESFPRTKKIPRPKRIRVRYLDPIYPDGMPVPQIIGRVREIIKNTISGKEKIL